MKYSFRSVGGAEKGSGGREDSWPGGGWRTREGEVAAGERAVPHFPADKPGGTNGEQDRPSNPGFQCGAIKPQNI